MVEGEVEERKSWGEGDMMRSKRPNSFRCSGFGFGFPLAILWFPRVVCCLYTVSLPAKKEIRKKDFPAPRLQDTSVHHVSTLFFFSCSFLSLLVHALQCFISPTKNKQKAEKKETYSPIFSTSRYRSNPGYTGILFLASFSSSTIRDAASLLVWTILLSFLLVFVFCCGDVCPVVVGVAEDVIREGEVFLDPIRLLDFVLEAEWTEAPESRGFMSLPLLPWRIKFLSCSRSGAILFGERK